MDPMLPKLGDVTIQRLDKTKEAKVGLQTDCNSVEAENEAPTLQATPVQEEGQGVKRNFEELPGPSMKKTKLEKSDDANSNASLSDADSSEFDSEYEADYDEEKEEKLPEVEEPEEESQEPTTTDYLEQLAQEPFPEDVDIKEEPKNEEDYDYDIKEKLKEMGEISFETVKKGEGPKPKKPEVSETEVSVVPAKKPGEEESVNAERSKGNLRRNIREVMDETKLDESTLAAQRQEMERLRRVQEQQKLIREVQRQMAQDRVISLLQGTNSPRAGPSASGRTGSTVLVKLPNGQTKPMTKLPKKPVELMKLPKMSPHQHQQQQQQMQMQQQQHMMNQHQMMKQRSLINAKRPVQANLTPSVSIAPVGKRPMTLSRAPSDSDSDYDDYPRRPVGRPKIDNDVPVQTIDISSDDDCIVVSESENDPGDEVEDPTNSGMHTNDEFNQPDEQGRVVINIGHPEDESDIYLAPQIARIIKPHQIGGIRFLYDNIIESTKRFETSTGFGCILAHSMGLGKTLQVVTFSDIFLRHTPAKTILCIMPINTLQNWMAEFNMWLPTEDASGNSPLLAHGEVRPRNFNLHVLNDSHKTLAARARVIHEWKTAGGVLLIGYEQYRLLSLRKYPKSRSKKPVNELTAGDEDKNKLLFDEVHESLVKPGPDLVICDEGHRIKNSHASISQALKQMKTKRRVVLTGYPLQNNLMEYWCMVDFVRPNYLGTKTEFCNMFERPIQNGQCIDSTEADIKLMRYRAHVLHSLLLGFVQRRSHRVLQTALPQKEEYVLLVRMTNFQRSLYEVFMNEVVRSQTVPNPLKAFAVCCKIWNHPDVLYYFLKKQAKGDAVDIDLEEVSNSTGSSETPSKNKSRSKKSKGKNSKPAASVTPYNNTNITSDNNQPQSLQQPPPPQQNQLTPSNMPPQTTPNQNSDNFPNYNQAQASNTNPNSFTNNNYNQNYHQNYQQNFNHQGFQNNSNYQNSDRTNFPTNNYQEYNQGYTNFNSSPQKFNKQSNFQQNFNQTNFNQQPPVNTFNQYQNTQNFNQANQTSPYPNTQNFNNQQANNYNNYQNNYWNSQEQKPDNYYNFGQYNQGNMYNQQWIKKEEQHPYPSSIKSDLSSPESKPKINIISDIKINNMYDSMNHHHISPEKKINILSDIKLEPKKEEAEPEPIKVDNDDDVKVVSDTTVALKNNPPPPVKEDTGIPYDWAIELLKDYVPGCIDNSAKMQILFCIIKESLALGDRLLVFSQSLITLDLIEQFLQMNVVPGETQHWAKNTTYYRLDGSTSALEREKLINEFNSNPKVYLFLVSTRAGSLGINLIGANRVVVLDASWNPCHDTQAVCRVYRYGQRKPCFVYRLVVDNCLEKKIYDRQINKQGMSDRVVDECNPDAHLTMKDVSTLCWDDEKECEEQDWSHTKDNYIDVVLQKVLEQHGRSFNKEPFQHESLLIDRKDKQLSRLEKRLAKKGYEREKQAARQPTYGMSVGVRGHRPVASVRPMQQGGEKPTRWIPAEHWQRQGMTAQEMTLPLDVVIPTNQPDKGNIVLKAGQKVLVLKSPKGVYMQLESGKIVAIKTAIKVRGKAEDDANKSKPSLPPAIKNNSALTVLPQKRPMKPFNPTMAKMNARCTKTAAPNLGSNMQKKKPNLVKRGYSGRDESLTMSSSEEERSQDKRLTYPYRSEGQVSLLKSQSRSESDSEMPRSEEDSMGSKDESVHSFKGLPAQIASNKPSAQSSALQQLEKSTSAIMSESKQPFQETLDSITSSYHEDKAELPPEPPPVTQPIQIEDDSPTESEETYENPTPATVPPAQTTPAQTPTTPSTDPPIKSDIPTPDSYSYNNYYNYNHMQPYPPHPPQGYPSYPPQPLPYDMNLYPQQQQPPYNYGMYPQGYPPQPQYPPPPPQHYDYAPPPPPQPMYAGYPPYPPQQYPPPHPPPPQGIYPPPSNPYPDYQYPNTTPHNPPAPTTQPYYPPQT